MKNIRKPSNKPIDKNDAYKLLNILKDSAEHRRKKTIQLLEERNKTH